jgi:hypothetical protein
VTRAALPAALPAALLVALLAGCSASPGGSQPPVTPLASPAATVGAPATATAGPALYVDTSLLAILPTDVGGMPFVESAEGESDAMASTVLPTLASAVASAVAVDTSTEDLVYVLIVRLQPGALDDSSFRDWRDSFDEGACGGATSVVGHAQAPIGGRTTYIGTCATGLRTYHVWLQDHDLLISASSTGSQKFGELLVGGLRP